VFWFWICTVPAIALAILSLRGERDRAAYVATRLGETYKNLPPASVIVPVKGNDEGLRENLAALASLDYPDYELLVVARTAEDIPPGVLPSRVRVILAAGSDAETGEKIQNLVAAVRSTRKRSAIFAFADSDGRVPPGWLVALAGPLGEDGIGATSGYRFYTPDRPAFWSMARSLWNAVIGSALNSRDSRFAWGGATAIRKETFFETRVFEYWKGSVSDDYALSAAVHEAGLRIVWAPGATVACPDSASAREFLGWARRQLTVTRIYDPAFWSLGLAAHIVYCTGMVASLAALRHGHLLGLATLALQLAPGMWKGARRAAAARASLPSEEFWFRRFAWAHSVAVPVATWLWMATLAASALGNTIDWRGNRYDLKRPAWLSKR
jgi:cellulose synthase/poly-beta-1,6-N-acetylglucosamine synthase-like glycosyltransferase